MVYINKISPKNQKHIVSSVIIIFLFLIIYSIFFNDISLSTITSFLFNYDLGRVVFIVLLIGVSSHNLFLGILLLFIAVFLYEYQYNNIISKYNHGLTGVSGVSSLDSTDSTDSTDNIMRKPTITVQDILNLENNISSKQSNNIMGLKFGMSDEMSNSDIMQINPSFEGTFNNNYAPFLQ